MDKESVQMYFNNLYEIKYEEFFEIYNFTKKKKIEFMLI